MGSILAAITFAPLFNQNVLNMKKLVLSIAIAAVASLNANAQISFGIQAGANLATSKTVDESVTPNKTYRGKTQAGFTAGFVANIPFSSSLSFRPELNFIQKGSKYKQSQTVGGITDEITETFSLNFIEMPLNIAFSMPAGPGRFCVGAGPNISYGVSGKYKNVEVVSGSGFPTQTNTTNAKVKFDGDDNANDPYVHLKGFDFGANAFVGYKMNMGLFFNAGYTYGFSNLSANSDASFRTAGITLKAGFLLGGKSKSKKED